MAFAHDDFADFLATVAFLPDGVGTESNDNSTATNEIDEALGSDYGSYPPLHTLWWGWRANTDGPVTLDTSGSIDAVTLDPLDTVLAVFSGPTVAPTFADLIEVISNDDGGVDATSLVTFVATVNTTYYIKVGSYNNGTDDRYGTVVLNWNLPVPPPYLALTPFTVAPEIAYLNITPSSVQRHGKYDPNFHGLLERRWVPTARKKYEDSFATERWDSIVLKRDLFTL